MNVNGVNFKFDRIVRLRLYFGSGSANSHVLEFAPLADPRLNAHIEAEVQDLPNPNNKNSLPGFIGKVTIFNPSDDLRRFMANHITWPLEFANNPKNLEEEMQSVGDRQNSNNLLKRYYDSRVRACLEVGYWNHEAPEPATTEEGVIKDHDKEGLPIDARREYRKLIEGYVNNSIYYHKGRDNIMEITIHDFDYSEQSLNAIKSAAGFTPTEQEMQKYLSWSQEDRKKRAGFDVINWDAMLRKLVANFAQTRPNPEQNNNSATNMSYSPQLWVTDADRANAGPWIQVKYIYGPGNKDKENIELRERLTTGMTDMRSFYTLGTTLADMINDLASYKRADVEWLRDDNYLSGKITIFVWPKGEGYQSVPWQKAQIQIVNYQNLLESPAVDATGSLYVRMFLNLDAQPLTCIALVLKTTETDNRTERTDRGGITDQITINPMIGDNIGTRYYYESLSFQGSPNPYWPGVQGASTLSVYSLQYGKAEAHNRGYMFNTGFPIITATHKISTHGKEWETSIKTVPMYTGLKLKDEDNAKTA